MANDIRTTNGELAMRSGDFIVADCEQTHVEHIVSSAKGAWRGSPITGVGIVRALNGPASVLAMSRLRQQIQRQLEYDGYTGVSIAMSNLADIHINAERL